MRVGFPIRKSADQRLLASPRSLSQRATSFIASWRQGIHRTLLSRSSEPHMPTRRTKPHARSVQPKLNAQLLLTIHFTLFTPHPNPQTARAAQRPRYVVTNHSDSPVKQHRHPAQTLLGPFAGQRNLSCRGTCAPSREGPPGFRPGHSTLEATSNTSSHQYGDGRYRTDGPLLAKQVLYH